MSESERPAGWDAAEWLRSDGGPEQLDAAIEQVALARDVLLRVKLADPSIQIAIDALRKVLRDLGRRRATHQIIIDAFEQTGWQRDAEAGGGFKEILPPGIGNRPSELFPTVVKSLCVELGVTSNDQATREQIASRLGRGADARYRGPIWRAVRNYLGKTSK